MRQADGLAQGGDGDLPVGLGFGAAHTRGNQRGFGVNQVLGQRQLLLEASAGQAGAFFGLGDRLPGDVEALVGGLEVEAGLLDFEVKRKAQLTLLFAGGFKIGVGLLDFGAGHFAVPEVPLKYGASGIAAAAVVVFPAVVIIQAAKGTDARQIAAFDGADLLLGRPLAVANRRQFRAPGEITRVRGAGTRGSIGHLERSILNA